MYTVNISFENKDNIQTKDIKNLELSERRAVLEKAFSTFYKKNVVVNYIKWYILDRPIVNLH